MDRIVTQAVLWQWILPCILMQPAHGAACAKAMHRVAARQTMIEPDPLLVSDVLTHTCCRSSTTAFAHAGAVCIIGKVPLGHYAPQCISHLVSEGGQHSAAACSDGCLTTSYIAQQHTLVTGHGDPWAAMVADNCCCSCCLMPASIQDVQLLTIPS